MVNLPHKQALLIIQSSPSGDPGADDWTSHMPEDLPDWVKDPENIGRMKNGEIAFKESEKDALWYRASSVSMTPDMARQIVTNYFTDHVDDLTSDTANLATKKWVLYLTDLLDQVWLYPIWNNSEPRPDEDFTIQLEERINVLIENAKNDTEAFKAIITITETLVERNQSVPQELLEWCISHDRREITQPRRHGKSPFANWGRDLHIAWAVYLLEQQGMNPTRNDASKTISGCDIVEGVLINEFNIPISYDGVKAVWKRYSRLENPLSEQGLV